MISEKFKDFIELHRGFNGGKQTIYSFPNGYGASVIRHEYSYGNKDGLWELAVVETHGKGETIEWEVTYSTPITNNVLGCLSDEEVEKTLEKIKALDKI